MRKTEDIAVINRADLNYRDNLIKSLIRKMVDLVDNQYDEGYLSEVDKEHYDNVIEKAKEAIGWE